MKKFAFIFILSYCLISCGNDKEEIKTEKDIRLKYLNNNIAVEGTLMGNKKMNEWRYYYPHGKLFVKEVHNSSHLDYFKQYQEYNVNGRLILDFKEEENNTESLKRFSQKEYSDDGLLSFETKIEINIEQVDNEEQENVREQIYKYYSNGNVMYIKNYQNNELIHTDWFDENGEFQGRVKSEEILFTK